MDFPHLKLVGLPFFFLGGRVLGHSALEMEEHIFSFFFVGGESFGANKAVYSNKLCNELWTKFQQCLEMEDFHCYVTYRDLNIFMCVLISKR